MIAKNLDEFLDKILKAEIEELNGDLGREITKIYLGAKLRKNPRLSKEEWEKSKSDLVLYVFFTLIRSNPDLEKEFADHLFNELVNEV